MTETRISQQRKAEPREVTVPRVTIEAAVDLETARRFWKLYLETFGEMSIRAVARQVLHEEEFMAEMLDPRVHKYLAWDENGEAIAMCTLTNHLETVPWISPEYFAYHFPEHTARNAVYYLGFILVSTTSRRLRLFTQMIGQVSALLAERGAVCAWDVCSYNNEMLGLAGAIETLLSHDIGEVDVEVIDTQTYYRAFAVNPHKLPEMRRGAREETKLGSPT
jgi:hypothetical protein